MGLLFLSVDEDIPLSPLAVSLAAGLSGSIAAAGSHWFDTSKSRSLCTVLPKVCPKLLKSLAFTDNTFLTRCNAVNPFPIFMILH